MPLPCVTVECTVGTYYNNSRCVKCPRGQYQDETKQTECKQCSEDGGFTTAVEGSKTDADCFGLLCLIVAKV